MVEKQRLRPHICMGLVRISPAASKAPQLWQPVNERVIRATFRVGSGRLRVIQVYAPTNKPGNEPAKEQFYATLSEQIQQTPSSHALPVMGDFNA